MNLWREVRSHRSAPLLQERNQVVKVGWGHSSLYAFRHQRKAAGLQAFDPATWDDNLLALGLQQCDGLRGFRAENSRFNFARGRFYCVANVTRVDGHVWVQDVRQQILQPTMCH